MGGIETGYVQCLDLCACDIIRFPEVASTECTGQENQRALIFVVPGPVPNDALFEPPMHKRATMPTHFGSSGIER